MKASDTSGKKANNKLYPLMAACSFLTFIAAVHITSQRVSRLDQDSNSLEQIESEIREYSSVPPSRRMELGKAKQGESKKEKAVIFNDPAMNNNWGIKKTDVARAWRLSQGSRNIVVAVIDTGVDTNHPDLRQNLWVNKGEVGSYTLADGTVKDKATDGIDNDNNGFVDDVHGWNFVNNNSDLRDNHGHGTHISGIIGAEGGNGFGISGVSPRVSLMVLKYYDPRSSGAENLRNTVAAIRYAVRNGAHIINYSGGGLEYSRPEYEAVKEAAQKQILFIAAAGNERSNSDQIKYYPADYELPNIISVTAVDPRVNVLATSNYGIQTVDIAAPGEEIFSTLPGGKFGFMTGTSQATAFVSGVAALLKARNPDWKADAIRKYILKTGDLVPSLAQKVGTSRKLNSYRALSIVDQGVGVSGVVALNTIGMTPGQFSSNPKQVPPDFIRPDADMSMFGRSLLINLQKAAFPSTKPTQRPL